MTTKELGILKERGRGAQAGISFGNSLIKQVVSDLSAELSGLKTFVTLSPIPGMARWFEDEGQDLPKVSDTDPRALAAHYLLRAKRPDGMPIDPVARFHLGNGATLHAVHGDADTSERGQAQSAGTMVNYLYDGRKLNRNHEKFTTTGQIATTAEVRSLASSVSPKGPNKG